MSDGFTRRDALTRGFGGVALVCSFKTDARRATNGKKTSAYVRSASSTPFDPFTRDLPIPPVLTPTAATKDLEQYTITMKPGKADILEGLETPVLGYNGLFPGPTMTRSCPAAGSTRRSGAATGRPRTRSRPGASTPARSERPAAGPC
jgi:hypothetical protein